MADGVWPRRAYRWIPYNPENTKNTIEIRKSKVPANVKKVLKRIKNILKITKKSTSRVQNKRILQKSKSIPKINSESQWSEEISIDPEKSIKSPQNSKSEQFQKNHCNHSATNSPASKMSFSSWDLFKSSVTLYLSFSGERDRLIGQSNRRRRLSHRWNN